MKYPSLLAALAIGAAPALAQVDVPLELWTHPNWPGGLDIGLTTGVAFVDLDADGWPDLFVARTGRVFQNLAGRDWRAHPAVIPAATRYGSSAGDFDRDGLADVATEPRKPQRMFLLRNLGQFDFVDVASDPALVDVVPRGNAETNIWADVDFDGDLDLFVPVYPPWIGAGMSGQGNFFLWNRGPTGPGGAYRFTEHSGRAGLDNPLGTERPEGADLCDLDGDGDPDLYCNGTLYVNASGHDRPRFLDLSDEAGILLRDRLDEGLGMLDFDMDGDFDLAIAYCGGDGLRIFDNQGDGSFVLAPITLVEDPLAGACLGFSKADWDGDGDLDLTTREVWRRNLRIESGQPGYALATHAIPVTHLGHPTPAWADWDRDGDLDCMLGDWGVQGHFYVNTTYDAATPDPDRRYLRVRVVDGDGRGLETEFGASVELFVAGDPAGLRRRRFVSSSGGYLNQNEYVLHFSLPADPFPADPTRDLELDV